MKNILCYGDSNTWGVNTEDELRRISPERRWTGILGSELGSEYHIIEEGLPGRTTVFDDPFSPVRNGEKYLETALLTHDPVDLLVIMLGTNDLKDIFRAAPEDVSWGVERLILKAASLRPVSHSQNLKILIISPIHMIKPSDGAWRYGFSEDSQKKSLHLAGFYRAIADRHGCEFMDAAGFANPSPIDGVHMLNADHEHFAVALAEKIRHIFG